MKAATLHTKESIQKLLDENDRAVIRALYAIHSRQTADEVAGHQTRHTNGIGFSKFDAPFLTEMVDKARRWGSLTPKQLAVTRNKIRRYHRQLCEIANGREEAQRIIAQTAYNDAVSPDAPVYSSECQCENYDGERECPRCERVKEKSAFSALEAAMEREAFLNDPDYRALVCG